MKYLMYYPKISSSLGCYSILHIFENQPCVREVSVVSTAQLEFVGFQTALTDSMSETVDKNHSDWQVSSNKSEHERNRSA